MISEGRNNKLSVQAETTFNAVSASTIYLVAGKTAFGFDPVHERGATRRGVWRQETEQKARKKFYRGSLTVELGINTVTRVLLGAFFELKATTALGGGLTKYEYRPRRARDFGSLKFGLEMEPEGPNYALHGAVIDSIDISINRRALVTAELGIKFVRIEEDIEMSATATAVDVSSLDHVNSTFELDDTALAYLQEFSFKISDPKSPARVGEDGLAARFQADGKLVVTGGGVEIAHSNSLIVPKVEALSEGKVFAKLADRENVNRYFSILWPRCSFGKGTPDGISRDELAARFSFDGLQDSDLDSNNEPLFTLVA